MGPEAFSSGKLLPERYTYYPSARQDNKLQCDAIDFVVNVHVILLSFK